jgi:hypothetical protein
MKPILILLTVFLFTSCSKEIHTVRQLNKEFELLNKQEIVLSNPVNIGDTISFRIAQNSPASVIDFTTYHLLFKDSTIEFACEGEIIQFLKTGVFEYNDSLCYSN